MPSDKPLISIVCPVYNEEVCVPLFFARLQSALRDVRSDFEFELLFTNNCSTDRTLEEIQKIRAGAPWVQVITLSRNFGYQASIMCGLRNAAGEVVIFIDVDCEDPPEMIPQFIQHWRAGNDVVYGRRAERPESFVIVGARKLFYRITRAIADSDFNLDMAEFSLISRRVRDVCLRNRSSYPFVRNEIAYAGFQQFGIRYAREARVAGATHYNLFRMTRFAIAGILSSSTFPLRFTAYFGLPIAFVDLVVLIVRLTIGPFDLQPLVLANFILVLIAVSGLSLFMARIYKDVIRRPLYIVNSDRSLVNRETVADNEEPVVESRSWS
jgi:glycosyltransferase involved in cell wall biosynthesis